MGNIDSSERNISHTTSYPRSTLSPPPNNDTLNYYGGWPDTSVKKDKDLIKNVHVMEGVKSIVSYGSEFYSLRFLHTVLIHGRSCTKIGSYVYQDCKTLISVLNTDGVRRIDKHSFYNCSSLTNILIPQSCHVSPDAFESCKTLIELADKAGCGNVEEYCRMKWRESKLVKFKVTLLLCCKVEDFKRGGGVHVAVDNDADDAAKGESGGEGEVDKSCILWNVYERIESDDVKRRILEYLDYNLMEFPVPVQEIEEAEENVVDKSISDRGREEEDEYEYVNEAE